MENSYGQTWLTGDVFGWFTLPMTSGTCDYTTLASLADQAAAAANINVGSYAHKVYAFPQVGACNWWGLGTVGGSPSQAWINGTFAVKVLSHEMGHNFGLYHSHSQPCDTTGCTTVEYGDDHDDMGQVSNGHFNAFQKERLGWLNYGSSPAIQTVSASNTYRLDPYEPSGGTKALKILKSGTTYYYVEARTLAGFDANDQPGVLIHTGSSADGNSSFLLDQDPVTTTFSPVLGVGQTFTDSTIGLSITPVSADASGASVNVTYAGPPCTPGTPSVSLSPSGTLVAFPNAPASYTVSVKNNDGSSCSSSTFSVGTSLPLGWTSTSNPGSMTLAPGASASATVAIQIASTASGMSSVGVSELRTTGTGPNGSASGTILAATTLNVALATSSAKNGYQISATVTASSTPVAGANVTFTVKDPTGKTTTLAVTTGSNGVGTAKGTLKGSSPRGTYQVTAVATVSGVTGTATGTFKE
jgi:hypothetical protein